MTTHPASAGVAQRIPAILRGRFSYKEETMKKKIPLTTPEMAAERAMAAAKAAGRLAGKSRLRIQR